jgi:hypothetical protein
MNSSSSQPKRGIYGSRCFMDRTDRGGKAKNAGKLSACRATLGAFLITAFGYAKRAATAAPSSTRSQAANKALSSAA